MGANNVPRRFKTPQQAEQVFSTLHEHTPLSVHISNAIIAMVWPQVDLGLAISLMLGCYEYFALRFRIMVFYDHI